MTYSGTIGSLPHNPDTPHTASLLAETATYGMIVMRDTCAPTQRRPHNAAHRGGVCHSEVIMADVPNLRDRIARASAELKLARQDGSAEWIRKAAQALDACIDEIPRPERAKETAT